MKLKNYEINPFINFLINDLDLIDQKSRMRTRFVKLLNDRLTQFKEEHFQLLNEHCNLDEGGNPIVKPIENSEQREYDVKNLALFNDSYQVLVNEDVVIEQNEEHKNMLLTVKDAVLNCGISFKGNDAFIYDRWAEIVEQIEYFDEN